MADAGAIEDRPVGLWNRPLVTDDQRHHGACVGLAGQRIEDSLTDLRPHPFDRSARSKDEAVQPMIR